MLRLTYISTAVRQDAADPVPAILAASRRNNQADGITGLLLYDGRRYLQALEGEAPAVERAFARIKDDPRHRSIVMLSSDEVAARSFGTWAMAAERAANSDGQSVAEQVAALTETLADPNLRALFRSFAEVRSAAA